MRIGRQAFDRVQPVAAPPVEMRHDPQQADRIGMRGDSNRDLDRSLLDRLAGIHDDDPIGIGATMPRLCVDENQAMSSRRARSFIKLENLSLHGDVERRRRLSAISSRGLQLSAMAIINPLPHAARELMRVLAKAVRRIGNADQLEKLAAASPRRRSASGRDARSAAP